MSVERPDPTPGTKLSSEAWQQNARVEYLLSTTAQTETAIERIATVIHATQTCNNKYGDHPILTITPKTIE